MERVFSVIVNENKKVLLLKDLNDVYTTLVGNFLDTDNNYTDTIIREVKKSTNLYIKSIENTRYIFQNVYDNKLCNYHVYITYVSYDEVKLSKEYKLYEWVSFDVFIDKINYEDDKELLKDNINKYLLL